MCGGGGAGSWLGSGSSIRRGLGIRPVFLSRRWRIYNHLHLFSRMIQDHF